MILLQGNNLEVQLPSAEFGNKIKLPLRVKTHRAMSGERYTYVTRPVKAVLILAFAHLNNNQVDEMYAFIVANTGKYITCIEDYHGETERIHTARILDGAVEFTHQAVRNNQFTLNLEVGDYA